MINEYKYSLADVSVIYAGVSITGFAGGDDAIVITPRAESWKVDVGGDGNVAYSRNVDNSFTIQLKLMQPAESNTVLTAIYEKDRLNVNVLLPLLIRNAGGRDMHTAAHAVISGVTPTSYGVNQVAKVWTLTAGNLIYIPAGNAPLTS